MCLLIAYKMLPIASRATIIVYRRSLRSQTGDTWRSSLSSSVPGDTPFLRACKSVISLIRKRNIGTIGSRLQLFSGMKSRLVPHKWQLYAWSGPVCTLPSDSSFYVLSDPVFYSLKPHFWSASCEESCNAMHFKVHSAHSSNFFTYKNCLL